MLTGSELLAKVKDLGDVSKTDLATACGYVSDKKDGSQRVNFTAFYEALLNAKGIALSDITDELDRREGVSGIVEKASRKGE